MKSITFKFKNEGLYEEAEVVDNINDWKKAGEKIPDCVKVVEKGNNTTITFLRRPSAEEEAMMATE